MQKWEYRGVKAEYARAIHPDTLNKIGDEGWELIAVVPYGQGPTGVPKGQDFEGWGPLEIVYYFKRPK